MASLELLKQLVGIPSDKSSVSQGGRVEYGVACFIRDYLKKNLRHLTIEEESVEDGRVNIFAHDGQPISLLLMCHMDTVEEGKGWTTSSRGELKGLRFYGRGSADIKCGLVAILTALKHAQETEKKGIAALFYADEEYDSKGIKKFVEDWGQKIKPELIICLEPTGGQLRRGCRGIVELRYVLRGKTGHAADPQSGISAFEGLNEGIQNLYAYLKTFSDPYLGNPSLNVATVRCGALQNKRPDGFVVFGSVGNIIPDYCEFVLEVRTIPGIDCESVKKVLHESFKKVGVIIETVETRMELKSFVTEKEKLKTVEDIFYEVIGGNIYQDIERGGYSDVQLLATLWDIPAVMWGARGDNIHGADEYVEINSFEKLETGLKKLVEKWHQGA